MCEVPQRRASLPVLSSAPLQLVRPDRAKVKRSRFFFRNKSAHNEIRDADVIPEHDVLQPLSVVSAAHAAQPDTSSSHDTQSKTTPPHATPPVATPAHSNTSLPAMDMALSERRSSSLEDDVSVGKVPWQYRRRRGSLPASAMPTALQTLNSRFKLSKSKSADKLSFAGKRSPGRHSRLFTVSVVLPSGFTQEVSVIALLSYLVKGLSETT